MYITLSNGDPLMANLMCIRRKLVRTNHKDSIAVKTALTSGPSVAMGRRSAASIPDAVGTDAVIGAVPGGGA